MISGGRDGMKDPYGLAPENLVNPYLMNLVMNLDYTSRPNYIAA